MKKFSQFIESLHAASYKSFYLALIRVALSLWLLKELLLNWTSLEILYGKESFAIVASDPILQILHINIDFLRSNYVVVVLIYTLFLIFNTFGIGRRFTSLMVYMFVELLQRLNPMTLNGGDNLAKFILLYLVFANTFNYFVLTKKPASSIQEERLNNLWSNLAAYSIMLHLCLAYFISGISKAHADVWYNGVATYYTLSLDRFRGTPFNDVFFKNGWFVLASSYFTILFELYFPVLIWIKKFRIPLIIMGCVLHLGIYVFMMIYGFQFIFMLTYGLFFSNEECLAVKERISGGLLRILKWTGIKTWHTNATEATNELSD